jgi:undecaprenyl diphosphate synthase
MALPEPEAQAATAQAAVPAHVAIIMDGNGRWAARRGLPRSAGHKAGVDALRRAVRAASDLGVGCLTIYSFSSENWSRPAGEVSFLMELLRRFIRQDVAELHKSGVRIRVIGGRSDLDAGLRSMLEDAETLTAANSSLTLVVAFNYGARQEIARAVTRIAEQIESGNLAAADVCPALIEANLDTAGLPPPDLLIRTGGEQRISNFLLWQLAYTEFVFVDEFWPDFTADTFRRAVSQYLQRDRRFGGVQAHMA